MLIVVFADDNEWGAIKAGAGEMDWQKADDTTSLGHYPNATAFIVMDKNMPLDYHQTSAPVFINSVAVTLQELNLPPNVFRINGWPGFLERPLWEVAAAANQHTAIIEQQLNKKITLVKDEPGFVSARIIAMIINEAYFALGDAVSTKEDIDIAMKLGTNYPFGPFEWAEKIGLQNIYTLLEKLSAADKRYLPAPLLTKAITSKI
jgi:3-hydroxybutyryl-CoA dehydrogenase